jgi:prevent-host-death family protein
MSYISLMKKASLTETKNRLSALIDEVREGETILVLDRGKPVARIESVVGDTPGAPGRLERLERKGLVQRARAMPSMEVLATRPPRSKGGASALRALLAEREVAR